METSPRLEKVTSGLRGEGAVFVESAIEGFGEVGTLALKDDTLGEGTLVKMVDASGLSAHDMMRQHTCHMLRGGCLLYVHGRLSGPLHTCLINVAA